MSTWSNLETMKKMELGQNKTHERVNNQDQQKQKQKLKSNTTNQVNE
jgi:hypothetical protein